MTTPTGTPAWERTTSVADYGGDASKTDYLGIGNVNPKTDVSAAQFLRMVSDLSAAVRASPLCTITFTCRDTVPDDPLVTSVTGMIWSYQGSGYDGGTPPTGYPSVFRIGDGHVRIAFAATYADDFGVSGSLDIRGAVPAALSISYAASYSFYYEYLDVTIVERDTQVAAVNQSGTVAIW